MHVLRLAPIIDHTWANPDPNPPDKNIKSPILNGLPPRAVVDSNVLLDAALIADGFGASALSALNAEKISLYIDDTSYRDAARVLQRHQPGAPISLEPLLIAACSYFSIMHVPPSEAVRHHKIKRQDSHLVRAATSLDAFVVTDDAPLLLQLHDSAMHGRCTRDLAVLPYSIEGKVPPMHYHFGGTFMDHKAAFIFMRCAAHASTVDGTRPESTLWESDALGRFFYDSRRKGLAFTAPWFSADICLSFELPLHQQVILVLNLDFPPRGGTDISIRAALGHPVELGLEDVSRSCSMHVGRRPPLGYGSNFQIGNSYKRGNGWGGALAQMSWGSGKIRSDAWKCYRYVPATAPNPLTANLLRPAIACIGVSAERIQLPLLGDVVAALSAPDLRTRPI